MTLVRSTIARSALSAGCLTGQYIRHRGRGRRRRSAVARPHLFEDDHSAAMTALGAMDQQPAAEAANVVPLLSGRYAQTAEGNRVDHHEPGRGSRCGEVVVMDISLDGVSWSCSNCVTIFTRTT